MTTETEREEQGSKYLAMTVQMKAHGKDILEKVPGTVFRLVRKSFWILLLG